MLLQFVVGAAVWTQPSPQTAAEQTTDKSEVAARWPLKRDKNFILPEVITLPDYPFLAKYRQPVNHEK